MDSSLWIKVDGAPSSTSLAPFRQPLALLVLVFRHGITFPAGTG